MPVSAPTSVAVAAVSDVGDKWHRKRVMSKLDDRDSVLEEAIQLRRLRGSLELEDDRAASFRVETLDLFQTGIECEAVRGQGPNGIGTPRIRAARRQDPAVDFIDFERRPGPTR